MTRDERMITEKVREIGPHTLQATDVTAADEARLFLSAQASGDADAVVRLFAPHEAHLYRLCLGITRRREDAEDAVQEALLLAWRGSRKYRGDSALRTWLTRIAINVCVARRRRPAVHIGQMDEADRQDTRSFEEPAVARILLDQALATLTPRQRAIWLLKEQSGWSVPEIARSNGWGVARTKMSLYRTRRRLADWARGIEEGETS
jgi:RNA polymerase sigma-70 factor, ECF subfamily